MSESNQDLWDDPRITNYVMNEMTTEETAAFESELSSNPELANAVDQARAISERVTGFFSSQNVAGLDKIRRESILQGSSVVTPVGREQTNRSEWTRPMIQLAIVASILVIVAGGLMWPSVNAARKTAMSIDNVAGRALPDEMSPLLMEEPDAPEVATAVVASKPAESPQTASPEMSSKEMIEQLMEKRLVDNESAPTDSAAPEWKMMMDMGMDASPALNPTEPARTGNMMFGGAVNGDAGLSADASREPQAESKAQLRQMPVLAKISEEAISPDGLKDTYPGPTGNIRMEIESVEEEGARVSLTAPVDSKVASVTEQSRGIDLKRRSRVLAMDEMGIPAPADPLFLDAEFGMEPMMSLGEGTGPGSPGDKFDPIEENEFQRVGEHPLSTFSIDVDTASYSKVRDYLLRANQLPRPTAVRIEEMLNYFDYQYVAPEDDASDPFAVTVTAATCPWQPKHRLVRIGIQAKTLKPKERPRCNLVFLIDTSGSMQSPEKLPLVIEGLELLLKNLRKNDRVAIVTYAGSAGLVLDSTPVRQSTEILRALQNLSAGGSTNGGAGLQLAYDTAREHFIKGGVNRVILCSDGDFNVGMTGTDALVDEAKTQSKSGIELTVLGYGMGNHNDAMMEQISNQGAGNYGYIDSMAESRKVLADQLTGTLVTVAKDVKIQVEFNPAVVSTYRLIGYENRKLAKEDFNDDKKDAGEIGAGHRVTALYEIVPAGSEPANIAPAVDPLKYQTTAEAAPIAKTSSETLTVKLRYKAPQGDVSKLIEHPLVDEGKSFEQADEDFRFATSVAGFGMQLRNSNHDGKWTLSEVLNVAKDSVGEDEHGLRAEFVRLVEIARSLTVRE